MGATVATTNRSSDASLEELLAFERLLSDVSARFANVASDQVVAEIEIALKQLLTFLGFDRGAFWDFIETEKQCILCSAAAEGVDPFPRGPIPAGLSWFASELRAGRTIVIRTDADIPPEAAAAAEYNSRAGIRSVLVIPLSVGGRVVAAIGFGAFGSTRQWPAEFVARLTVIGEVMAQVLARTRSEAALLERNAAQEMLANKHQQLLDVLDNAPVAVAITSADIVRYANRRTTELLGAKVGDRAPDRYVHPGDRDRLLQGLSQHGVLRDADVQLYGSNNEIRDVLATLAVTHHEGHESILAWLVDVSDLKRTEKALLEDNAERRQIEETLRENRQLLESVLENSAAVIYAKRKDGRYTYINREWEVVCNLSRDQVLGRTDFDLFPKEIAEQFRTNDLAVMAAGKLIESEERVNTPVGEQLFLSKKVPLTSIGGEVEGMCGISTNITDLRRTELALREAKALAEEATKSKSEFLANMSHEIRTPMNAIIGLSDLCLKTELSTRQRDYVSKIHGAGLSLLELINSILDFSKIEAGKLDLEVAPFSVDAILENLSTLVAEKVHEKGLELLFDIAHDIPPVLLGDQLRLRQILTNLVSNAIKFTEQGEIRVVAEKVEQIGDRIKLKISVADTGIGMTEEQVSRLFQPFSQADSSTSRKYGGTGLGLAISKTLVEMMCGSIEVESRLGLGSTFRFTISLRTSDQAAPRIMPERLSTLRVLIADDNANARDLLEGLLKPLGASVTQVASGAETIQAVKHADNSRQFDLLLLDWRMPGMDGIEVARRLKADSRLMTQPAIVIVAAHGCEEVRVEAEKAGLNRILIKPVTSSTLLDTLIEMFVPTSRELIEIEKGFNTHDLSGLRVLLAEDNLINQQIAVELLNRAGASVEVANDGREAVTKLLANDGAAPFDVVLMDLQMPEVDGYQATAKIRSIPRLASLPIIALTAHALSEERDRCLAAGMRGHISKPINPEVLYTTLKEYRRLEKGSISSAIPEENSNRDDPPLNIPGIDTTDGLNRVACNTRLYRALLRQFADNRESSTTRMQEALDRRDYVTAERLAHTVKGSATNLGAKELSNLADRLERAIRSRDAQVVPIETERLTAEWARVADSIGSALKVLHTEPGIVSSVSSIEITSLLGKLKEMLISDDGQSLDYFLEVRDQLASAISKGELDGLQSAVAEFDFGNALSSLSNIAQRHHFVLE